MANADELRRAREVQESERQRADAERILREQQEQEKYARERSDTDRLLRDIENRLRDSKRNQ